MTSVLNLSLIYSEQRKNVIEVKVSVHVFTFLKFSVNKQVESVRETDCTLEVKCDWEPYKAGSQHLASLF